MGEAKPDRLLGRTIAGKYRIEAKIGQGGMGSVYRARNLVTGKLVALKVLLEDLAAYPSFVERFLHEARAAAYITHPHAINIMDCGRDGEIVYLLMEYLEGETLTQVMRREGPFSPQRAARILTQICSALAEAHAQGIVHRDLKPDNIILQQVAGEKDYVKILDFGIAKVLDEQKRGSSPVSRHIFVGTPEYASPEQCRAKSPTALSDIYSLGVILYEMLAGRPPFEGDPMDVMLKHIHEEPPPLRAFRPELSPEIEAVVRRALSKDPADRPQSVWELAEQFERAVRASSGRPTQPSLSHPTVREAAPKTRPQAPALPTSRILRLRWRPVLLGLLLLTAVGGLSYRAYRWIRSWPPLPAPPVIPPRPAPRSVYDPLTEARRLFEAGERESAAQLLQEMLAGTQRSDPRAHALLGQILMDLGELEGARNQLLQALEQSGGVLPEAHLHLGRVLLEEGDLEGAERAFLRALEQSGGRLIEAAAWLGELYQKQGRTEEAARIVRAALERAGEAPEDVLGVGRLLLLQGQYELAVRELRRAIRLKNGSFPEAYLWLGRALLLKGDVATAIEVLTTALAQRGGKDPATHHELGRALYRLRDYERAITHLQTALRLRGGNYPDAQYDLARVLSDPAVGRYAEAEEALRAALNGRKDRFPEALEALGQLYGLRLGRLDEARRIWQKIPTQGGQAWLERTRDALLWQAGPEPLRRILRTEAPARLHFEIALAPNPTERQLLVTFLLGDAGLGLRWERPTERSLWSVRPVRVIASREEELEPLNDPPDWSAPIPLTLTFEQDGMSLMLAGRELVRVKIATVRPTSSSDRGDRQGPLLVSLRGGRAVLFHFREEPLARDLRSPGL